MEARRRTELRVTAVVLNYDGRHFLETILPSLERQTAAGMEVLVVDDGSRDDSVAWLRREWPSVEVVDLPRNVGITAALNRGVEAARGKIVVLLNNDMELDPWCVEELILALEKHPEAGSVCAKLLDFERRYVLDGTGDQLRWTGVGDRRGHGEIDRGQYDRPGPVFSACAGAAAYRRAVFSQVGPFDEGYFAYFEDVDWGFRAQLLGLGCRYVPTAVAYHMGSATAGVASDFTRYHLWRNAIWLVVKNYPLASLVRHAPQLILYQALVLASALKERKGRVLLRAWRDALLRLPDVLRERRRVQLSRRIDARGLEAVVRAGR